jgi:primosomal protein N' (replication factor Y)
MDNIGVIIMDEEHDLSFKQDVAPFYHARDIALYLSHIHQCPLVLGSATPSLESYARALKGVYTMLALPNRINNTLATLSVVNMKEAIQQEGSVFLSNALKEAIALRLSKQEQIIILLNRRGYLPTIQCSSCFEPAMCKFCDVMLTFHNEDKKLHCHHCGHVYHHYECPSCHSRRFMGSGLATQRLESVLSSVFPQAKVARLDYDNTKTKNAHQIILEDFTNKKQDILIGTQMVAKGLDIPNVTLVGILQADAALSFNDYHINESVYAMISQAAGRSGRHDKAGEVIIQAFDPSHYVIEAVLKHDYHMFFQKEMHYRKQASLPPYFYLIALRINDTNQQKAYQLAVDIKSASHSHGLTCLGPVDLGKKRDRFNFRLVYKTKQLEKVREDLARVLEDFTSSSHKLSINVSPYHLE